MQKTQEQRKMYLWRIASISVWLGEVPRVERGKMWRWWGHWGEMRKFWVNHSKKLGPCLWGTGESRVWSKGVTWWVLDHTKWIGEAKKYLHVLDLVLNWKVAIISSVVFSPSFVLCNMLQRAWQVLVEPTGSVLTWALPLYVSLYHHSNPDFSSGWDF